MFISRDWPAPGSKLFFGRSSNASNDDDWDIYQANWVLSGDFDLDGDVRSTACREKAMTWRANIETFEND